MATPEEVKAPEMSFTYQVDQQVSVNSFFDVEILGETVRFQITSRYNSSAEKIAKTLRTQIEAYQHLRQEFPRTLTPPPPQEPKYVPVDEGGSDLPDVKVATAGRLSVEMKDGKFYFKVMDAVFAPGEKGTKFGVNVYPEVLKAAGLQINFDAPSSAMPSIAGWRVDYICNEKGYPAKVTRLLPPK